LPLDLFTSIVPMVVSESSSDASPVRVRYVIRSIATWLGKVAVCFEEEGEGAEDLLLS
jgi:hypothetical protein